MKRLVAAVLFLTGLAILIGLGTWQYQRLQWKNNIIADLDAQYERLESKSSTLTHAAMTGAAQTQERPFLVDKMSGRIHGDKAVFMGPRSINGQSGYDVIVPVVIDGGTALAHLGWINNEGRQGLSFPRGHVVMNGVARKPDHSRYAGGNSPENDLWFHMDIEQMAKARDIKDAAPLIFFAYDITPPVEGLQMPQARWYPRNKHQQYMLFWFGMAAAWVGVFALAYKRAQRQG